MAFLLAAGWLRCLQLSPDEVPQLVVLEGTWWAAAKAPGRLGRLEGARELALPGIHHGWYGAHATGDAGLLDRAGAALGRQGITVHRGTTVTTSALLTQHRAQVSAWASAGRLAVDMETSAVYSAAAHFGMNAAALLYCWDELSRGRSWLDTFAPAEVAAQLAGDQATYSTALEIGCGTGHKEAKAWN